MLRITSGALEVVRGVLGLEGSAAQVTEVTDGIADQGIDLNPFMRRGLAPGFTGFFAAQLSITFAGAGSDVVALEPFTAPRVATGGVLDDQVGQSYGPYPLPGHLHPNLDLWLLSADLVMDNDVLTSAFLRVGTEVALLGLATNETLLGEAQNSVSHVVAGWLATELQPGGPRVGKTPEGRFRETINMRIPRGTRSSNISFAATVSGAASMSCRCILGVFPASLGQDVAL